MTKKKSIKVGEERPSNSQRHPFKTLTALPFKSCEKVTKEYRKMAIYNYQLVTVTCLDLPWSIGTSLAEILTRLDE